MSDTASRNPTCAAQMLADALLRTVAGATATLRVAGTNANTDQSEIGTGGDDVCRGGGFAGGDAEAAAGLERGRAVEVGAAGLGDGGAAGR
jgi:hypothetical protein